MTANHDMATRLFDSGVKPRWRPGHLRFMGRMLRERAQDVFDVSPTVLANINAYESWLEMEAGLHDIGQIARGLAEIPHHMPAGVTEQGLSEHIGHKLYTLSVHAEHLVVGEVRQPGGIYSLWHYANLLQADDRAPLIARRSAAMSAINSYARSGEHDGKPLGDVIQELLEQEDGFQLDVRDRFVVARSLALHVFARSREAAGRGHPEIAEQLIAGFQSGFYGLESPEGQALASVMSAGVAAHQA